MSTRFKDRTEAGGFLVDKFGTYADRPDVLALTLPCGGLPVLNRDALNGLCNSSEAVDSVAAREDEELRRREREDRPTPDVTGKIVIVIDDGLASDSTMRSVVMALRGPGPGRLVVAVPITAPSTSEE